jgi:ribosomal-protein-serine acetyltransferase
MLHAGSSYEGGNISILAPVPARILAAHHAEDVADAVQEWLQRAQTEDSTYYFSIESGGNLVGQVVLHDIDETAGEALVGYHLFQPEWRGKGIGSTALRLLQHFVAAETDLRTLILITSGDNVASCRAAEKAGFRYVGRPREDPSGVLLTWHTAPLHRSREREQR